MRRNIEAHYARKKREGAITDYFVDWDRSEVWVHYPNKQIVRETILWESR